MPKEGGFAKSKRKLRIGTKIEKKKIGRKMKITGKIQVKAHKSPLNVEIINGSAYFIQRRCMTSSC